MQTWSIKRLEKHAVIFLMVSGSKRLNFLVSRSIVLVPIALSK